MKRNPNLAELALLILLFSVHLSAAEPLATGAAERPNVVLIMADDMGYECLGCNGGLDYRTPHLDALAKKGIRFKHCYSLPLCTPSRVKIMTGRYSFRNYERFALLSPSEITFGKQLQQAGYRTAMVGKWQLGGDWRTPTAFGFDEYCLLNGIRPKEKFDRRKRGRSRYWGYPPVVVNGELYESEHTYGPDMFNEYAIDFIKRESDRPFFLYYPMVLTHSPFEPSPLTPGEYGKDGKTSEVRYFKDMVEYADHLVGNIIRALEETGRRENTLVLFTGDNGTTYPVKVTDASPDIRRMVAESGRVGVLCEAGEKPGGATDRKVDYREGPVTRTTYGDVPGGKDLMNDFGTHVPLVVDWPKYAAHYQRIGHESDDLVDFSDFFATFAELAGADMPGDRTVDGISFADRLTGRGSGRREYVFCHYWGFGRRAEEARDAIHDGKWKLYSDGRFFHLAEDLEEENSLDLEDVPETAVEAHRRLSKAYEQLRGISIPVEVAPSEAFPFVERPAGITLEQKLEQAKAKAKRTGKGFNAARTTRWFNAKDLNGDGVMDEKEQKTKAPKGWNRH